MGEYAIMSEEVDIQEYTGSWQRNTLIIGALVGALVGLGAAYLRVQRAESEDEPVNISAGEAIRLTVLVLGLVRTVGHISGD